MLDFTSSDLERSNSKSIYEALRKEHKANIVIEHKYLGFLLGFQKVHVI